MNLSKADLILAEIRKSVEAIAAKHGCSLKPQRGKYSLESVSLKVELVEVQTGGKPADFDKKAQAVGLPAGCFGKQFGYNCELFEISDIATQRPKRPIIAKRVSDGKSFAFEVKFVCQNFSVPLAPSDNLVW